MEHYLIANHHHCHMIPHIPRTGRADGIKDQTEIVLVSQPFVLVGRFNILYFKKNKQTLK